MRPHLQAILAVQVASNTALRLGRLEILARPFLEPNQGRVRPFLAHCFHMRATQLFPF